MSAKTGMAIYVGFLTNVFLSALVALPFMFAAPFFRDVIGAPHVHPGYLPCWLVLFTFRELSAIPFHRRERAK